MGTVRLICSCIHAVQDKMYGRGVRLHNIMKNPTKARCTVCNAIHDIPGAVQKEVKKDAKKKDA